MGLDLHRLSRTLTFLLRHGAGGAGLSVKDDGWCSTDDVARAASRAIHRPVCSEDVREAALRHGGNRFEVEPCRLRAREFATEGTTRCSAAGPDILYHAAERIRVPMYQARGSVSVPGGGFVHLSRSEGQAWRVAHRQWEDPMVLFVDAARARRDGVTFERTRTGQFQTRGVPVRHVLNLRDGFAEQASAGGFLVEWSTGLPRIALIHVCRRGGATWEVAKGKIEPGEAPEVTAVREVREEMGVVAPVCVRGTLGTVRYGFCTPDGAPRLKTIHLYVLELTDPVCAFDPALAEDIDDVRWFELQDALAALAHPSLRGSIGRLLDALEERAAELGVKLASGY